MVMPADDFGQEKKSKKAIITLVTNELCFLFSLCFWYFLLGVGWTFLLPFVEMN